MKRSHRAYGRTRIARDDLWMLRIAIIAAVIGGFIFGALYAKAYAEPFKIPTRITSSNVITSQLPLARWNDATGTYVQPATYPVFHVQGSMTAGLSYRLTGSLQTTTGYLASLQAQVLTCRFQGGNYTYSAWSTTNHLGTEHGAAPVTVATTSGEWIFTAPATADYTCTLHARAGRIPYPTDREMEHLSVTGGAITLNTTSIPFATEWRQPDIAKVGGTNGVSKWVLVKRYTAPIAISHKVYTGTQLTSISTGQSTPAVADITTYVTQLTTAGQKCMRYTKTTRATVSGKLHHLKIAHTMTVPYTAGCSPAYAIQVLITYVQGHGMQVEGPSYTSAYIYAIGAP